MQWSDVAASATMSASGAGARHCSMPVSMTRGARSGSAQVHELPRPSVEHETSRESAGLEDQGDAVRDLLFLYNGRASGGGGGGEAQPQLYKVHTLFVLQPRQ